MKPNIRKFSFLRLNKSTTNNSDMLTRESPVFAKGQPILLLKMHEMSRKSFALSMLGSQQPEGHVN